MGGTCPICMVDNSSVIVLRGTGEDMVPVPEMASFGEARGFEFRAHEKGDANRSAVVEGLFDFVQNNFLVGRKFHDFDHANREAVIWCDKINAAFSRKLHAARRDLFAAESHLLVPLPAWRSPVYRIHTRLVDLESYVNVHTFRYEVPARYIGHQLEVRETKTEIQLFDGRAWLPPIRAGWMARSECGSPSRSAPSTGSAATSSSSPRSASCTPSSPGSPPGSPSCTGAHLEDGALPACASFAACCATIRSHRSSTRSATQLATASTTSSASETMILRNIRHDYFPRRDPDDEQE
ncbi:MAG: hypothetical protein IPI67_00030 [Myxococcales bacterium]|nr:hypothetical protein [Myxococcales bacterium]